MSDDLLLTIDGHSMAFRAFYALPPEMVARDGTPTNAVYGFMSMMSNVIGQFNPTHLAVAFDTAAPTFRVAKDDQYKAQRGETPELFKPQVGMIIELLEAMNIEVCTQDGMEADDLIATYSTLAMKKGMPTICVTGDRDYFQLVNDPCVKVMYVRRGVSDTVLYDEAGIVERTGIRSDQYVDYAAMRGDPSDNLPGVAGIGEKTAAKLLQSYENLEGIYDHLDDLPPKQRANLENDRDRVFLNREMMTLVRDVKDLPTLTKLARKPGDGDAISDLCDKLQFRAMSQKLLTAALVGEGAFSKTASGSPLRDHSPRDGSSKTPSTSKTSKVLKDKKSDVAPSIAEVTVKVLAELISDGTDNVGVHLDSLRPNAYVAPALSFPIPVAVAVGDALSSAQCANIKELTTIMESVAKNAVRVVGYDTKSWGAYFAACEIVQPACIDLNVMACLDDPSRGRKNLEQTCAYYLGVAPSEAATQLGFEGLGGEPTTSRIITDVMYLLELFEELTGRLESKKLTALYADLEQPLTPVISGIETYGVFVDQKRLKEISKDIHARCTKYQEEIHSYAGEPFNVNSTQQLRRILFDQLGLTPLRKTKTGASTDAETLNSLRDEHPIVEAILRYREVEKLRSTYIDVLGPLIAVDGRIHATFNQIGSNTGRISSDSPNLQNIPIRTEEGKKLREMFVAPKGFTICSIDYSQIELRILAHMSKEKALVDAFQRDDDVHKITAAQVFHVKEEDVTYDQRSFAKVVNYGIAYGMESWGLATRMGIDPGEAKDILEKYWTTFTSMRSYLDSVVSTAQKTGYTETLFGRRRYFPELSSSIGRVKAAGARAATNAPVQGTAADVFKLAMVKVAETIVDQDLPAHMVLTVHDELVFEVQSDSADEVSKILAAAMENVVELDVPLVADVGLGDNWASAK